MKKKNLYLIVCTTIFILFNYVVILIPMYIRKATYTALTFMLFSFVVNSELKNIFKIILSILILVLYVLLHSFPEGNLFGTGEFA